MKQGDAKTMAIVMDGLDDYNVDAIRIIFKQEPTQEAEILKEGTWKADGTGDIEKVDNVLKIFWSVDDTYKFKQNQYFYADYQIKLSDADDMPSVEQTAIKMDNTLFAKEA